MYAEIVSDNSLIIFNSTKSSSMTYQLVPSQISACIIFTYIIFMFTLYCSCMRVCVLVFVCVCVCIHLHALVRVLIRVT